MKYIIYVFKRYYKLSPAIYIIEWILRRISLVSSPNIFRILSETRKLYWFYKDMFFVSMETIKKKHLVISEKLYVNSIRLIFEIRNFQENK